MKFIYILILSIILIECKSNNDEKKTVGKSDKISNSLEISETNVENDRFVNLKMCKVYFYRANESIVPEVSKEEVEILFKKMSIQISENEIIFDGKKSSYKIDKMDSKKFFTRKYIYDVKVDAYKKGFNIDLSKEASYLNLSIENNDVSPFQDYFMEAGDAIFANDTLFLNYYGYLISFVNENYNSDCSLNNKSDNQVNSSQKKIKLPFDFQKYMDRCYLEESSICKTEFPFYKADELSSITSLINSKINKNVPNKIYCIENGGQDFETYIFEIQDESEDYFQKYILINVKNDKIIANQEIGRSINGDAPEEKDVNDQTFTIDKDLTISIFNKVYKKKNIISLKYKINSDGSLIIVR